MSDKYIQAFYEDYDALGCKRADDNPRVSEYIPEIIEFIKILFQKVLLYEINGDVYFRTCKK